MPLSRELGAGEVVAGRYEVGVLLGTGGMGSVYQARDRAERREVALKVVRQGRALTLQLRNEFRAMTRLRHPRLVEVYDYGELGGGEPFFTMELLPGRDLAAASQLPLPAVYRVVGSVCDALAFVHARGYVHRDIKPANVRLLPEGDVKLMDFGTVEGAGLGGGVVAGTMVYLAPEAHHGAPADPRSDLYALGVLAYELVTGRPPFAGTSAAELFQAKLAPVAPLDAALPGVPAGFARLVADLIAPEPSGRPTSAVEVLARLGELAGVSASVDPQAYLRAPALVGRGRELAVLREQLAESAGSGQRVSVFVLAPAGAGKTRLVEEAMVDARLTGARVVETAARHITGKPYEALRRLLGVLVHAPGADAALAAAGGLAAFGGASPEAVTDAAVAGAAAGGDPAAQRAAVHGAVGRFLDALARTGPLVISIDDIHLCDGASLEALETIARWDEPAPIALVGTIREGEARPIALARMMARGRCLGLPPLAEDHVGDLMLSTLGRVQPARELLADLARSSEGNAYFLLEILRSLMARSAIRRTRTGVELPARLEPGDVPGTLAKALAARLDGLPGPAHELLRLLALFDRDVELELLGALFPGSRDDMLDALDELRRAELVDVAGDLARPHHPRVREVALAGLAPGARAALHRHAAQVLEARGAGAAELGFHFAEAGDQARALRYLRQAGHERFRAFAYHDAGRAYGRALEFVGAAPWWERRRLRRMLCDRLGRIWFFDDVRPAIDYFTRARTLHLKSGILAAVPFLSRLLGRPLAGGVAVGVTALVNLVLLRPHPLRAAIERVVDSFAAAAYLAVATLYSGRVRDALAAAELMRPYVYSRKRLPQVGYLSARVTSLIFRGHYAQATADSEEALAVLDSDKKTPLPEHDRVNVTAGMLSSRCWCDLLRGDARETPWTRRLAGFVDGHSTPITRAWHQDLEITRAATRGELDAALARWDRFRERIRGAELFFVQEKVKYYLGGALIAGGRAAEAADLADGILAAGRQGGENPMLLGWGKLLAAQALRAWGNQDEAARALDEAEACFARDEVGAAEFLGTIVYERAWLAFDRGDLDAAARLCADAARRASQDRLPTEHARARVWRLEARIALQRGAAPVAAELAARAAAVFAALELPLDEALARHAQAQAARALGDADAAAAHAAACERTLVRLGNLYQLRALGFRDTSSSPPLPVAARPVLADTVVTTSSEDALADTVPPRDPPPRDG